MGQSYRIRTEQGINKTITVQIDQEFEFLEILSLKIQQSDIYLRNCSDYGVVVGRVTANNGFGIPNARISVFIPIEVIDQSNPIISSIYPYKSPSDKNQDGYRYNLLPYEKSYSAHAATGTLPSRLDALTGQTAIEIYDKYYRYTAKTNESGDYMIMGVPLGTQTLFMDVDLSDIGEFSLTPQDLIRMGLASEAQVAGGRFKSSTDLNSLPQIINLSQTIEISPLWGDSSICQIAVNRLDFDLREKANIDIRPTSVFMGSIGSTPDKYRVKKNAKPKDDMGNLCSLVSGPGQILTIRQTINQDSNGNPVLEEYTLEQSGNIIDGNGVWMTELPMNLDYYTTNEFGEKVISYDPTIGIPTKAKYRFKIKWQQPKTLTEQTRRPYYLIPNIKEYGWKPFQGDPYTNLSATEQQKEQLQGSYYFGLDWSGYTNQESAINCEDTFYMFEYNKVYTVSSLITEFKKGGKGRFIGIKEIDSQDCESTTNKFPTNDGFRNFDFLFFLFSILMQIIQLIGIPLLVIYHFLSFLWNNFAVIFLIFLIGFMFEQSVQNFIASGLAGSPPFPAVGLIIAHIIFGILFLAAGIFLTIKFASIVKYRFGRLKLSMMTYPECQACECDAETTTQDSSVVATSLVTQLSNPGLYYEKLNPLVKQNLGHSDDDTTVLSLLFSQSIGGRIDERTNNTIYKTTESQELRLPDTTNFFGTPEKVFSASSNLPLGERINVFNGRKKYFDGINRLSVSFDYQSNINQSHFDSSLTVLMNTKIPSGTLLTFLNPSSTTDVNFLYTASTANGIVTGISGTSKQTGYGTISLTYANPSNQTQSLTQQYFLNTGTTESNYKFPSDIEYYQVVTAFTISEISSIWNTSNDSLLPGLITSCTDIIWNENGTRGWGNEHNQQYCTKDIFADFNNQYITIIQRGVDPYSPLYNNSYGIGKILGLTNESDYILTARTRVNIPIQPITSGGLAIQEHNNQNNIFYSSYFWEASNQFSSFTTSNVGYYSSFDANFLQSFTPRNNNVYWNGLRGIVSSTSNSSYSLEPSSKFYDNSEDLSGVGYLYTNIGNKPSNTNEVYVAPSLLPTYTATPLNIVSKVKNVMRTDRLPNSNYMDGSGWDNNAAVLQQNLGFTIYVINTDTEDFTAQRFGTGADIVTADIEGQINYTNVIESLSTCSNLVGLSCYSGYSGTFGIKENCQNVDSVQNGCYILVNKPLKDLGKDIKAFEEWAYRFRFFYGLCRGVLAQSFVNNWINGFLYMFPIQVDTYYDKKNQPLPPSFTKELVYFDTLSNNFYYRSSPYITGTTSYFVGAPKLDNTSVNERNLLFPTTIINLGIKDSFYQEIIFDPSARAYIVKSLNSTSYSDTSDIVNLFVISRIANAKFLSEILLLRDNGLDKLFSRPEKRIDADLAQAMSINSEFGVIPFSQEFYSSNGDANDPVSVYGGENNPTIGIFFSSTTEDLQNKDFLTPGVIDFRPSDNVNAITYPYGIYSQEVPFYRWGWDTNTTGTIFGDQYNNWKTTTSDIFSRNYQSLDRRKIYPNNEYFIGFNTQLGDIYERGYIFNIDGNGNYESTWNNIYNKFLVGAPNHFYFGLVQGESAIDKFKTKYSISE